MHPGGVGLQLRAAAAGVGCSSQAKLLLEPTGAQLTFQPPTHPPTPTHTHPSCRPWCAWGTLGTRAPPSSTPPPWRSSTLTPRQVVGLCGWVHYVWGCRCCVCASQPAWDGGVGALPGCEAHTQCTPHTHSATTCLGVGDGAPTVMYLAHLGLGVRSRWCTAPRTQPSCCHAEQLPVPKVPPTPTHSPTHPPSTVPRSLPRRLPTCRGAEQLPPTCHPHTPPHPLPPPLPAPQVVNLLWRPGMLCAPRQLVLLRSWRQDADGTFVVLYQSTSHRRAAAGRGRGGRPAGGSRGGSPVSAHVDAAGVTISPLLPRYTGGWGGEWRVPVGGEEGWRVPAGGVAEAWAAAPWAPARACIPATRPCAIPHPSTPT